MWKQSDWTCTLVIRRRDGSGEYCWKSYIFFLSPFSFLLDSVWLIKIHYVRRRQIKWDRYYLSRHLFPFLRPYRLVRSWFASRSYTNHSIHSWRSWSIQSNLLQNKSELLSISVNSHDFIEPYMIEYRESRWKKTIDYSRIREVNMRQRARRREVSERAKAMAKSAGKSLQTRTRNQRTKKEPTENLL